MFAIFYWIILLISIVTASLPSSTHTYTLYRTSQNSWRLLIRYYIIYFVWQLYSVSKKGHAMFDQQAEIKSVDTLGSTAGSCIEWLRFHRIYIKTYKTYCRLISNTLPETIFHVAPQMYELGWKSIFWVWTKLYNPYFALIFWSWRHYC